MDDQMNPRADVVLDAALKYANAGLPVIPCRHDKTPSIAGWRNAASTDPEQLCAWWSRWPEAMIGPVTGARSSRYVVDVDVEGFDGYGKLGLPPSEVVARTPSGGGHIYFRWPGEGWNNTASKIVRGVDTRGEGGYVVAPPSIADNTIGAARRAAGGC